MLSEVSLIQSHFLHAFVDSFRGCYKDGTEPRTRDLRWLSAYGLFLRLGICILFTMTLNVMYFVYALLLILIILVFLVNFHPLKSSVSHYTNIDITFLIFLLLHYISILGIDIIVLNGQQYLFLAILSMLGILLLLYFDYLPNTAMDLLKKEMEWVFVSTLWSICRLVHLT
jgi:hypothetical protein